MKFIFRFAPALFLSTTLAALLSLSCTNARYPYYVPRETLSLAILIDTAPEMESAFSFIAQGVTNAFASLEEGDGITLAFATTNSPRIPVTNAIPASNIIAETLSSFALLTNASVSNPALTTALSETTSLLVSLKPEERVSRIILFTSGAVTNENALAILAVAATNARVTLSVYACDGGTNTNNAATLANAGGGVYASVDDALALERALSNEFISLVSPFAFE